MPVPGIELKLHNVTGRDGLAMLRADQVDLAVGSLLEVPDDVTYRPVVTYSPTLITPLDHPLASLPQVTLAYKIFQVGGAGLAGGVEPFGDGAIAVQAKTAGLDALHPPGCRQLFAPADAGGAQQAPGDIERCGPRRQGEMKAGVVMDLQWAAL